MEKVIGLKCRECERQYPKEPLHVCEFCFGPLEVDYDYEVIRKSISRKSIEDGPDSLWRYADLLPIDGEPTDGLNSGFTPLIRARNLEDALGVNELYIKDDSVCHPTLSFKDRVVAVALSKSKEFGFDTVSCASTGNLANAVAAHAAIANLNCFIFIPADLELGKVIASLVFAPIVVGITGNYDDVNRLCSEIAGVYQWAFANINLRPFYAEGSKTLCFELIEQLGWEAPDHLILPAAGGSLVTKAKKSLKEFHLLGLIDEPKTKIHVAQAEGCGPIVATFKEDGDFVKPVKPNTIAKSLAIGNPADGIYAVSTVRDSGGQGEFASDEEIVDAIKLLAATEGIFTETAGGVTLAVTKKLIESGHIGRKDRIVVGITGNGFKTIEALDAKVEEPHIIQPQLNAFKKLMTTLG
ncbi:MAG: threonine synthase [Candidatus Poribacteria bacterium]|nr:threonine synthase [Candidatus Poribacteria bacterium]